MKELNRKVFKTIFIILSIFIITGIVIYNVSSYKKEYDNVKRNLSFMEDKNIPNDNPPEPVDMDSSLPELKNRNLDNMMIMDYEIYTVKLNNRKIVKITNHSNNESDFDVQNIAQKIIDNKEELKVGNLYHNKYSYNYQSDMIVILNTKNIYLYSLKK